LWFASQAGRQRLRHPSFEDEVLQRASHKFWQFTFLVWANAGIAAIATTLDATRAATIILTIHASQN
jgi:hypothetical protein